MKGRRLKWQGREGEWEYLSVVDRGTENDMCKTRRKKGTNNRERQSDRETDRQKHIFMR